MSMPELFTVTMRGRHAPPLLLQASLACPSLSSRAVGCRLMRDACRLYACSLFFEWFSIISGETWSAVACPFSFGSSDLFTLLSLHHAPHRPFACLVSFVLFVNALGCSTPSPHGNAAQSPLIRCLRRVPQKRLLQRSQLRSLASHLRLRYNPAARPVHSLT